MNENQMAFEAIYYSAPIPRNSHVLTMLGVVFDQIHFPGVYMPIGDYDDIELDKEIRRLEALDRKDAHTYEIIGMLRFVPVAKTLGEFCVVEKNKDGSFRERINPPEDMVRRIYDSIHGPPREGFVPDIRSNFSKALPGCEECILYPGDYHYLGAPF
ncbi:hypothetical protein [Methylocystis sp. B8]|uniref:hypothetical protein n=1 Tax=Methylocystis sp. B8 TaxID=544938 RepID=UPI0010FE2654|nr:hypothetical protein [Methylocystis sp. B8]TLG77704.1 hypothetical protein FEV16_07710 [Methylocystis sp. B8]